LRNICRILTFNKQLVHDLIEINSLTKWAVVVVAILVPKADSGNSAVQAQVYSAIEVFSRTGVFRGNRGNRGILMSISTGCVLL
jgi:hypothetical protein